MKPYLCSEKFNTALKIIGIIFVIFGFIISYTELMLLGILFVVLVLSNMLFCESYLISQQIKELEDKFCIKKDSSKNEENNN